MATPSFDLRALFEAVNVERERRGLSWAALSREIGVASSTIRRYANADDAEADGVLATLQWLDATPEHYINGGNVAGTRLQHASEGHVRVDMQIVAEANGDPRGANGRTRTTIQTLASTADRSGQPVASLTRLTEI
jgi:transcriptional regulator with XRE-family HTH domain